MACAPAPPLGDGGCAHPSPSSRLRSSRGDPTRRAEHLPTAGAAHRPAGAVLPTGPQSRALLRGRGGMSARSTGGLFPRCPSRGGAPGTARTDIPPRPRPTASEAAPTGRARRGDTGGRVGIIRREAAA
ncbi:hypothetical protein CP970_30805 [Streptomyces kanamyceticus]|uniref:Uncharacterized protein n=1 Tax=Streptomyces kanamyceticus TaxID=1967 RepID=A0A5J6GGT2_STRKN|nr:hypothetical protein CP970_30805 [Streptomyces kanamyceticus]